MEYCARCLGARAASTVAAQSKTRVAVLTLGQMKLDTELCEDFVRIHNPAVWEEIPVNTDLCLHIQRCAVQATGKALGTSAVARRLVGQRGQHPGHARCPGGDFWLGTRLHARPKRRRMKHFSSVFLESPRLIRN